MSSVENVREVNDESQVGGSEEKMDDELDNCLSVLMMELKIVRSG